MYHLGMVCQIMKSGLDGLNPRSFNSHIRSDWEMYHFWWSVKSWNLELMAWSPDPSILIEKLLRNVSFGDDLPKHEIWPWWPETQIIQFSYHKLLRNVSLLVVCQISKSGLDGLKPRSFNSHREVIEKCIIWGWSAKSWNPALMAWIPDPSILI